MKRGTLYQLVLLGIIACVFGYIALVTQQNLEQLGVQSNFDFLWKRAGFELGQTLIPYDAESTIARAFTVALLNTLVLAIVANIVASILGLVIGLARLSGNWLAATLATAYVEIFRNIPSLLQIFFWYFVVLRSLPRPVNGLSFADLFFLNNHGLFLPAPALGNCLPVVAAALLAAIAATVVLVRWARRRAWATGKQFPAVTAGMALAVVSIGVVMAVCGVVWEVPVRTRFGYEGGLVLMPEFIALVVGLSMYNATYISEIVRSAFTAIPRGQIEAAESLGLPRRLSIRLVLFPQALRIMIPPLTTQYLNLFKGTSLAAAIAYPEIVSVFVGTVNNLVGQPVVVMAITLATYTLISLFAALILNAYNQRIARVVD